MGADISEFDYATNRPTKRRPRLLYLAYFFRPADTIACVRTWNTAVHLTRRGWDIRVVTPHPSLWVKAEDPSQVDEELAALGITRILTGHDWPMLAHRDVKYSKNQLSRLVGGVCRRTARALRIENRVGWVAAAERACAELQIGDVNCILATGGPYVAFRLAGRLARRLRCPFVLDYRDPWGVNPHAEEPHLTRRIPEEAGLLEACQAVTAVSPSWARLLDQHYGVEHKTHVISNGYDPAMFAQVTAKDFDRFAVVYAGTLYPPKRTLDPVLESFGASLKLTAMPMRFHYYGDCAPEVHATVERLGLQAHVEIHGDVPRAEALSAQKGADVVVVVTSVEDEGTLADRGIVTGKIFDCLALERPALVVAPPGSDMYAIAEATGGMRCFTGGDISGMTSFILDCTRGETPARRSPEIYQWDVIGAHLDCLLRSLVGANAE